MAAVERDHGGGAGEGVTAPHLDWRNTRPVTVLSALRPPARHGKLAKFGLTY
jgi:hypothetical protein